jgi:2-keto-4-pentenoate hydratase/2-oxohepta-3-ene-1,7-dioic acid hydratase in catechol pathway
MKETSRRELLATAAGAVAVGAIADTRPAAAQGGPKPIFSVPATTIPIVGESDVFPVRRIYCIGRNYAAHAIERGSDPNREPPFFFQKPTDAIQNVAVGEVADHSYPSLTKNYHHEVELVAALKSGGTNIPTETALGPCLRLCARPRHDPARLAERHGGREEAVGDRQEL